MGLRHTCARVAMAVLLTTAAHSRVTADSQRGTPCRTYSAAETRSFSSGGGATQACDYNTATHQHTCTLDTRTAQSAYSIVTMYKYASAADFVDEVKVIPTISRMVTGSTRYTPSGAGARNSTLTFSYDTQRRLTTIAFLFDGGTSAKTTFAAWDASGRPTKVTGDSQAFTYSYDDTARMLTITNASFGGRQTQTFDMNGNLIREESAPPGGAVTTTTTTITKTAKVCR